MVTAVVFLAAAAWTFLVVWHGLAARDALQRIQDKTTQAGALAVLADLPTVRRDLATATHELREVQGLVGWLSPPLGWLAWVPGVGPDLAAAPHLLEIGVAGLTAADAGLEGGQAALDAALGGEGIRGIAEGVTQGAPAFVQAEAALRTAVKARAAIAGANLDPVKRALGLIDRGLPLAQQGVRAALALPDLMGMDGPRRYLVLGQNNDELRATGGFIGTAGVVTVERGQITGFDYGDSYAYSGPVLALRQPPRPFVDYMLFAHWHFRDSNWWADFPTSVKKAEEILQEEMGLRVDGVIALDQDALVRILQHMGKVEVPGSTEQIDAANVVDLIEQYAHPTGYKEGYIAPNPPPAFPGDRKAFIAALAKSLMARMQALDPATAVNVGRSAAELLEEKHLLLSFHNPEVADLLRLRNWDGAVPAVPGDSLMVMETNIGYSKANKTVRRRIAYDVELGNDLSIERATVTVTYENTDTRPARHCQLADIDFFTADDSCYKSYVRVYAPPDSALLGMEGFNAAAETYAEGTRTVFANAIVLQPGETKQVRVSYRPPRGAVLRTASSPAYRLSMQKQPGDRAVPFSFQLRLPPDTRLVSSDPAGLRSEDGVVRLETDLLYDRALQVALGR